MKRIPGTQCRGTWYKVNAILSIQKQSTWYKTMRVPVLQCTEIWFKIKGYLANTIGVSTWYTVKWESSRKYRRYKKDRLIVPSIVFFVPSTLLGVPICLSLCRGMCYRVYGLPGTSFPGRKCRDIWYTVFDSVRLTL